MVTLCISFDKVGYPTMLMIKMTPDLKMMLKIRTKYLID
jgi:hypothetical protein